MTRPGDPFAQVADVSGRFVAMARLLSPDDLEVPADGTERNVRQTVQHVCEQFRSTAGDQTNDHPDDLDSTIAEIESLTVRVCADLPPLGEALYGAAAYLVGECVVHGGQIARAVHADSWRATAQDWLLYWRYGVELLGLVLSPASSDVSETWELHFAGQDAPVVFAIDEGSVARDPASPPGRRRVLDISEPAEFDLTALDPERSHPDALLLASRFSFS